jgi:chromosome segregation ATPase
VHRTLKKNKMMQFGGYVREDVLKSCQQAVADMKDKYDDERMKRIKVEKELKELEDRFETLQEELAAFQRQRPEQPQSQQQQQHDSQQHRNQQQRQPTSTNRPQTTPTSSSSSSTDREHSSASPPRTSHKRSHDLMSTDDEKNSDASSATLNATNQQSSATSQNAILSQVVKSLSVRSSGVCVFPLCEHLMVSR